MHEFIKSYITVYPEKAARFLESTTPEVAMHIFTEFEDMQESMIQSLSPSFMIKLLKSEHKDFFVKLLSMTSSNILVTTIKPLDKSLQLAILEQLSDSNRLKVEELLRYGIEQVGYYLEDYKVVLNENSSVSQALDAIDNLKESGIIFVVSKSGEYLGIIDLCGLIKKRHNTTDSIQSLTKKKGLCIKASTPIKNIIHHSAWLRNETIPVLSKTNCLLGVMSRKKIKNQIQKVQDAPLTEISSDKIFYAYDAVWEGLQKFWGAVK